MPKKRRNNPYRLADIIIAAILGAVLGFTISLMTDELLKPIVFYGDLILAFMLAGAILGVIGGNGPQTGSMISSNNSATTGNGPIGRSLFSSGWQFVV